MNSNKTDTAGKKSLRLYIVVIVIILMLINPFFGNPISRILCEISSRKYIREKYPDFAVAEPLFFDFSRGGCYSIILEEYPGSDNTFLIEFSRLGYMRRDGYEREREYHNRTWNRMIKEYDDIVTKALSDSDFDFNMEHCIALINIEGDRIAEGDMPRDEFIADKEYDYKEIGYKYGHLMITVKEDNTSPRRAAEILLDIRDELNKDNLGFYNAELWIMPTDVISQTAERALHIENIKYRDIYPDNLAQRIEQEYERYEQ